MSEDIIIQGRAAAVELEQTEAAFSTIRAALVSTLLKTSGDVPAIQSRLVATVQALDLVRDALIDAVQSGKTQALIEQHAAELAQTLST